jgi:hypothetical protein
MRRRCTRCRRPSSNTSCRCRACRPPHFLPPSKPPSRCGSRSSSSRRAYRRPCSHPRHCMRRNCPSCTRNRPLCRRERRRPRESSRCRPPRRPRTHKSPGGTRSKACSYLPACTSSPCRVAPPRRQRRNRRRRRRRLRRRRVRLPAASSPGGGRPPGERPGQRRRSRPTCRARYRRVTLLRQGPRRPRRWRSPESPGCSYKRRERRVERRSRAARSGEPSSARRRPRFDERDGRHPALIPDESPSCSPSTVRQMSDRSPSDRASSRDYAKESGRAGSRGSSIPTAPAFARWAFARAR